jgi:hypothetical protein
MKHTDDLQPRAASLPSGAFRRTLLHCRIFTTIALFGVCLSLGYAADLKVVGATVFAPLESQSAYALNQSVTMKWKPVADPNKAFDHYAVYRSTSAFTSVEGMKPIAKVSNIKATGYRDGTAKNGVHYYYAATTVFADGSELKVVASVGPRTPWNETDLQVASISRTPAYPRYVPVYTEEYVTEPSGFGPYLWSRATGLGGGQTADTKRWPAIGDTMTYTATIRNRGTNPWRKSITIMWKVDNAILQQNKKRITLDPGATTTFTLTQKWDNKNHAIYFGFSATGDARAYNNSLTIDSKAAGFYCYIDRTYDEVFREFNKGTPGSVPLDDDIFDYLNHGMDVFNGYFEKAGTPKRAHYDILQMLEDTDPLPKVDLSPYAVFPGRYGAGTGFGNARNGGVWDKDSDFDRGMIHEQGHQLGMIDIYQINCDPTMNKVNAQPFMALNDLMNTCYPTISPFHAGAMTVWEDKAHGYFGQYMYHMPKNMQFRVLGPDSQPISGATVKMYQLAQYKDGKYIKNQVKFQGITDEKGIFPVPNVHLDPALPAKTFAGDELHDNPFGYLDCVARNGLFLCTVDYGGKSGFFWFDITEAVTAATIGGKLDLATFDKQVK